MQSLLDISLESGALVNVVYSLSVISLGVLATKRPLARWLRIQLLGGAIGAAVGFVLAWLISEIWNTFDVALSATTYLWFVAGVGAIGFAVSGIARSRLWRRIFAGASVGTFTLMLVVGVNSDIAEWPTVGSAFGLSHISALSLPAIRPHSGPPKGTVIASPTALPTALPTSLPSAITPSSAAVTLAQSWKAPAGMPRKGSVGTVTIPATVSGFHPRQAIVYLPPAARVANAPRLPVLMMLSGQPGQPSNVVTSGQLPQILDDYALTHDGLAPIVVIPDQLGVASSNPMCVDSPEGNSATYLTVDVPNWITSNLHVLTNRVSWAIGGFSQGGTCSIQLGAGHPQLFGSVLDICGQETPHNGSIAATIASAFGGSREAFLAAAPIAIMQAGAPYPDTLGIFAIGQNDTRYGSAGVRVSDAARAAGMTTHFLKSQGTAHDWHTVHFAITRALPLLYARWGLS